MTPDTGSVGDRMARIFGADVTAAPSADERIAAFRSEPARPETRPAIPAGGAEPVRELLRRRDYPAAAAAAARLLLSVGIDVDRASTEGVETRPGTGNPAGMRTADRSSTGSEQEV
jgi:hypothetical protein